MPSATTFLPPSPFFFVFSLGRHKSSTYDRVKSPVLGCYEMIIKIPISHDGYFCGQISAVASQT